MPAAVGVQCDVQSGADRVAGRRVPDGLCWHHLGAVLAQRDHGHHGLLERPCGQLHPYVGRHLARVTKVCERLTGCDCARVYVSDAVITCEAGAYGFATWPTVAPMGVPVLANGTCAPGYTPTDPGRPPQRLCPAAGTYGTTLVNPCIRM
jgi:hypothetical protein